MRANCLRWTARPTAPLGRVGRVSDAVDGVLFLESSPYIAGEILQISGGQVVGH
jgi:NAD(P)-dependent dehydrogenase (short-subunit alcohol dehydrogenase family)